MQDTNTQILNKSYKNLREKSHPDFDYYLMLILSSIICFLVFE